jgi:hypothetical protein
VVEFVVFEPDLFVAVMIIALAAWIAVRVPEIIPVCAPVDETRATPAGWFAIE